METFSEAMEVLEMQFLFSPEELEFKEMQKVERYKMTSSEGFV